MPKLSDENFKTLVDRMPEAVFIAGDRVLHYANPAMVALLGYESPHPLVGASPLETFVHPDDGARLASFRTSKDAESAVIELRWIRRDGAVLTVQAQRIATVYDGAPASVVFVCDVTEQRRNEGERARAEAALRASEERYRLLFDASPLPMLLFEPEHPLRILAVNDAALETYGYSREELLALNLPDLKVPEDLPALYRNMDALRTPRSPGAQAWRGVQKHRRRDGAIREMDISSHSMVLDGRTVRLAIAVDMTETRRLEQQLRQAQKMDAIGQLAAGVAHDFNNMLAVILADAQFALTAVGEDHAAAADISEIAMVAGRAAALTRQLLVFSRRQPLDRKVLALNSIVIEVEKMLCRIIGENIALTLLLSARLGSIEADQSHIEQILVNLAVNSRDAMPRGGRLAIETSNVDVDHAHASSLGVTAGRYVMLSVSDDGCGMDPAVQARMFEPFFTTKPVGKGTGLGLSTVFGIVQQSGGGISVHSALGTGTTFKIYFPCDRNSCVVELESHSRRASRQSA